MVDDVLNDTEEGMKKAIERFKSELAKVRTAQLNRARAALNEWAKALEPLPILDDFPDVDWRDAPTDVSGEVPLHGVADLDVDD